MSERLVTMLSQKDISDRVKELGAQIAQDYRDRHVVLVVVLKGSFIFAADLCRAIDMTNVRIEFLGVRSYGEGTETSGVVQITQDLSRPIAGEDVIIVEDIVDTGLTLSYLQEILRARSPKSLRTACLLSKPSRRRVDVKVEHIGFTIEDRFVVGYGLDYGERYRNLPYIGVITG